MATSIENFSSMNSTPLNTGVVVSKVNGDCLFYCQKPYGFVKTIRSLNIISNWQNATIEVDGIERIDDNEVLKICASGVAGTSAVTRYGVTTFDTSHLPTQMIINTLVYVDHVSSLITDIPAVGQDPVGIVAGSSAFTADVVWFGDFKDPNVPVKQPQQINVIGASAYTVTIPAPQPPFASPQAYVFHLKSQQSLIPESDGKFKDFASCKKCSYPNEYKHKSEDYICRRCLKLMEAWS